LVKKILDLIKHVDYLELNKKIVYLGFRAAAESPLCALAGSAEAAQGARVASQVLVVLAPELVGEVLHHAVVKVLAAQMSVSSGGLDLEDGAFVDGEDADVKGAASQVENQHVALTLKQKLRYFNSFFKKLRQ